jgi:hypothetical protein
MRAHIRAARPDDEIVDNIIRKLTARKGVLEIAADVRRTIAQLRELDGPLWGNRTENLDYFRKVSAWTEKLQATLAKAPSAANTTKLRRQIDKLLKLLDSGTRPSPFFLFAPIESENLDRMFDEAEGRCFRFGSDLGVLRNATDLGLRPLEDGPLIRGLADLQVRCRALMSGSPGEHGLSGRLQKQAAIAARELMERWGRKPGSTDRGSPFRRIASLLYEAVTKEMDHDMERACDVVLRIQIRSE